MSIKTAVKPHKTKTSTAAGDEAHQLPRPLKIAVLSLRSGIRVNEFCKQLYIELQKLGETALLASDEIQHTTGKKNSFTTNLPDKGKELVAEMEASRFNHILYVCDRENSVFAERSVRVADTIVLLGNKDEDYSNQGANDYVRNSGRPVHMVVLTSENADSLMMDPTTAPQNCRTVRSLMLEPSPIPSSLESRLAIFWLALDIHNSQ